MVLLQPLKVAHSWHTWTVFGLWPFTEQSRWKAGPSVYESVPGDTHTTVHMRIHVLLVCEENCWSNAGGKNLETVASKGCKGHGVHKVEVSRSSHIHPISPYIFPFCVSSVTVYHTRICFSKLWWTTIHIHTFRQFRETNPPGEHKGWVCKLITERHPPSLGIEPETHIL